MGSNLQRAGLALLGIVAFVIIGTVLKDETGLPFDTSYRVACAAICLFLIFKLGQDYPGERWPRVSFWLALLVNLGLFLTPLVDRPASRGELLLFVLPDAAIVLMARIVSYPVVNAYQHAMRQQMILGMLVAVAFCAFLFTFTLAEAHAR